jgi:hypothetical protein
MKWIFKGRTVVSEDGRFRIAKVFRGWILYDRGVGLGDYPDRASAMNHAEREEQRDRALWGALA